MICANKFTKKTKGYYLLIAIKENDDTSDIISHIFFFHPSLLCNITNRSNCSIDILSLIILSYYFYAFFT